MGNRYLHSIFIFLMLLPKSYGQTDTTSRNISFAYPVYSQYLQNGLIINPAYAGSREVLSFFTSGRMQWGEIDGAPRMETVSLHSLLKNDRVGLGLTGQFMQYGVTSLISVYGNYAYHLRVGSGKLSLALRGGFDYSSNNYSKLENITRPDEVFADDSNPFFKGNVGFGTYYYNKKLFIGAAIPSFLGYSSNQSGDIIMKPFSNMNVQVSAGILVTFSKALKLKPSVFVDYSTDKTKPLRMDLNANLIIYDIVWIGGSWRTSENVAVAILQLQVTPQLMVGYSRDFPVGTMSGYWEASNEVVLRFEFGKKISAANPRYF
jgi:type IX secretion system PorP/SprF family membrane protein